MNPSAIPPLVAVIGALLFVLVWQMVRRPVQRRYATRDVMRRPGESVLVVAGSLLGTALIAGSFIVGDTLDASVKQRAWTQLGPVDEVITVDTGGRAEEIVQLIVDANDPLIDGVMSLSTAFASVASDASGKQLAEPGAQVVELDFEKAEGFGGDSEVTGISGPTPAAGKVVVTNALASEIQAGPGDDIVVHLYGRRVHLTVDRVVDEEGLAGFWTGLETDSPNAFVPMGTIASATRTGVTDGAVAPATRVVVSNRGGVEEGAAHSGAVSRHIESVTPEGDSLRVSAVKSDVLERAEAAGQNLGTVFLTLGMFAIIAGVLLLVNIFVMLAEERKGQLGMLRAIGTRRSDLVRIFLFEGAMFSLAAGAAGAVTGIGVGWVIVKLAAPIFSGLGDSSLDFRFHAETSSILGGFCIGVLISMVTILLTSVRISRINIIRAIRDLPESTLRRSRPRTVVAGSILTLAAAGWFASTLGDMTAWAPALLGPPLALLGAVPLAGRVIGNRRAVLPASIFGLIWGTLGNTVLGGQITENGDLTAFVLQGVLLVSSAVVVLTQLQENFEGVIRRVAARKLSLRLGFAYPLARRFRTGLTLGMYSLVIFTLVMVGVLSTVFGGQVATATEEEAGGYDILATAGASNPPRAEALETVDGVDRVVATNYGTPLFEVDGFPDQVAWPATGITREFTDVDAPELAEFAPRFDNQQQAWAEVASNDTVAVVSAEFLQQGGPPENQVDVGDSIGVVDPVTGRTTTREIVGLTAGDEARSGAYMSFASLDDALGGRAGVSRFYVVASGALGRAEQAAAAIQGRFVANGVEAETFRAIVEEGLNANLQFMRLMQAYLALGLIIGIAGLGVVMVRAVRDRRREIGVLRALGFVPRNVRAAFLLESSFVSLAGILIGASLALVTASQLIAAGEFGEGATFAIPWFQLGLVCVTVFVASLAATARPAQRAAKIPPAVALRIAD